MKTFRAGSLILAALLVSSRAFGALRLDESFGSGGVASVYSRDSLASAVALQADGKVVAVGTGTGDTGHSGLLLARFTAAGALDPSFGTGGLSELFAPPNFLVANAVAIDSANRILVAGSEVSGLFLLARFLANGSPDPAFGSGGLVLTGFPGGFAGALSLAIQPDGRIVVVGGFTAVGGAPDFAAARYAADGGLDASFGSAGRVVLDVGGASYESATSVVLRGDGRIVLGGRTDTAVGYELAIAQLLADGTLDGSFGTLGKFVFTVGQANECRSLALQSDGKIVAAGPVYIPDGSHVIRLLSNGSLDPAFGTGGVAQVSFMSASAAALDGAGRIAVGGTALGSMAVTRLLPSGALDPGLGSEGFLHVLGGAPPNISAQATALAVQPDGRIVLAGGEVLEIVQLVTVVRFADGATAPIPTLSEIGLSILGVGLALIALLLLRRN